MLNLNDVPYLGLHGNRTGVYNLNASSLLSRKHESTASSMVKKCTLSPEKFRDFMASNDFVCISSYSFTMIDDTLNENDFKDSLKNHREKYVVDSQYIETYEKKDPNIIVQVSIKEYSLRTDDGHKLVIEIDNTEISFLEKNREYCKEMSERIIHECYQRASQFIDEETPIIGIIGSTPEGSFKVRQQGSHNIPR